MNSSPQESFDREYAALRSGCGVVTLTGWSSITLTGRDRQAFLNNFCTNDVKRLTPGTNCEAFFANVKGKIIGHGLVTCRPDSLVVIGPPRQGDSLAAHLERYVIREDVQVRNTTGERVYLLIAGGSQARKLAADGGLANDTANRSDQTGPWIEWNFLGTEFCGLLETDRDIASIRQALIERGAMPCDATAFDTLRIEAGMPLFGVDFDEQNLPQEVGRNEHAISFTKGCYLGQETVARIDALGHVNQQLVGVQFHGTSVPERQVPLSHAGKAVGTVTSATLSPQLRAPLALAMVRRPHCEVGRQLDSPIGHGEVIALPL